MLVCLVCLVVLGASSCQGAEKDSIRIGILADCEGFGASYYDVALAGAELPLIRRGGALEGADPVDGVGGVSVGDHPVELTFGCAGDALGGVLEARRLVELEGVDVLIGPNVVPDTPAMVEYARHHPDTTFVIATMEHLTASERAPNLYRFTADAAQIAAGLGSYAFGHLGWRRAATLSLPDLWGWGAQAGFVAEFCSLGGVVVDREWVDVPPDDVPTLLEKLPLGGGDGYFVSTDAITASGFLQRYATRDPRLARHVVVGSTTPILLDPTLIQDLGDRLVGIVTASFVPLDRSRPQWRAYEDEFAGTFPEVASAAKSSYHLFDLDYVNAMEAVMDALETVHGDLSDGAGRFQEALAAVRLDAPNGPIVLDPERQAVVPVYLSRVEKDEQGELAYRTIRMIAGVDENYGGILASDRRDPDRTQPRCAKATPPPWSSTVG